MVYCRMALIAKFEKIRDAHDRVNAHVRGPWPPTIAKPRQSTTAKRAYTAVCQSSPDRRRGVRRRSLTPSWLSPSFAAARVPVRYRAIFRLCVEIVRDDWNDGTFLSSRVKHASRAEKRREAEDRKIDKREKE